jgi:hypothetical protein
LVLHEHDNATEEVADHGLWFGDLVVVHPSVYELVVMFLTEDHHVAVDGLEGELLEEGVELEEVAQLTLEEVSVALKDCGVDELVDLLGVLEVLGGGVGGAVVFEVSVCDHKCADHLIFLFGEEGAFEYLAVVDVHQDVFVLLDAVGILDGPVLLLADVEEEKLQDVVDELLLVYCQYLLHLGECP